jgi:leucyl aminopeptidase (aminopeptidase T)
MVTSNLEEQNSGGTGSAGTPNGLEKFIEGVTIDSDLERAARVAINEVLAVKKDEKVLIVTNPVKDVMLISMALYNAVIDSGGKPSLLFQPVKTQLDFAEPAIIKAIESNPEVTISISHKKMGKDIERIKSPIKVGEKKYDNYFHYLLGEKKMRSFWSPSVTLDMFKKTVPIDYAELRNTAEALKKILDKAEEVHIKAEAGTDLTIGLKGRETRSDDGNFGTAGTGGNLPCGEVFISPELHTAEGTIAFDGSISSAEGAIVIKEPINVKVSGGFCTDITGGREADELNETLTKAEDTTRRFVDEGKLPKDELDSYLKNIRHLGELGIGLNPAAEIVGNILEDEKVFRTCHIAIGSNYDEDANALTHLDGLVHNPTMIAKFADGKELKFMDEGKIINI